MSNPKETSPGDPVLSIRSLSKSFRGLVALHNVTLDLLPGEIHGVIGPNGAGKTTLFNCLTGALAPTSGEIHFRGRDIAGLPTPTIAQLGLARTFQNIRLFGNLSVLDNVRVAQQLRTDFNLLEVFGGLPSFQRKEATIREAAFHLLETFNLAAQWDQQAMNLPYGAQRRLEMARALATTPVALLLDEPAAGMNETETDMLHQMIKTVQGQFKVSIILVEHDMRLIMNLCDRVMVLNYGEVIAHGAPAEIRQDSAVIESYLGKTEHAAHAGS